MNNKLQKLLEICEGRLLAYKHSYEDWCFDSLDKSYITADTYQEIIWEINDEI